MTRPVWVYSAALYCDACGADIAARLACDIPEAEREDSNRYPQRVADAGESDTPDHCDACHAFLESRLTDDGRAYAAERIRESPRHKVAGRVWRPFYESTYGKGFWK
jgi:hypothetical protein